MARAITKSFGSSLTTVSIKRIQDGVLIDDSYQFDGRKSKKAVQTALFKKLGTKNFMIVDYRVEDSDCEETYTMSAELFYSLSDVCAEGESYGHEFVTNTAKITLVDYLTMDGEKQFSFIGTSTESKIRKMIIDSTEDDNILITSIHVGEQRRYLHRDTFIENATRIMK